MINTPGFMEQYACRICPGDTDAFIALWASCKRWAVWIANTYRNAAAQNGAVSMEDLEQCAALGVLEAARTYKEDGGSSFLSWCAYYVRKECREALGLRGRTRWEHYASQSLDTPLADGEGLTLADTIPSGEDVASTACARVDDASIIDKARSALAAQPAAWALIRAVDLEGRQIGAAAQALGMTQEEAKKERRRGLQRLRHTPCIRLYNPYTYMHRGLDAFRSTHTSVTEAAALWNLNRANR